MINIDNIILYCVCSVSTVAGFLVAYAVRDITFCGVNTDNQKQVFAASNIRKWRWFSDMHKYAKGKAWMKDSVILALSFFQKMLKDKKTDYPLVVLCICTNTLSAILIFLISNSLWGLPAAIAVFLLFISSLWIHQIAIFGAAHTLAQFFFLLFIYFIQQANNSVIYYLFAGLSIGLMLFSSASSRKYIPLALGFYVYSQLNNFTYYRQVYFYSSLILCPSGFFAVFTSFTLPNIKENLRGYYSYSRLPKTSAHFRYAKEYFAKMGYTISENMRGAGWKWIFYLFWNFAPFQLSIFLLGFLLLLILALISRINFISFIVICTLSISPILIGELTKGHQEARAYFPGFLGLMVLIGYSIHYIEHTFPLNAWIYFCSILTIVLGANFIWNIRMFISDVLPARMAPGYLEKMVKKMGLSEIWTYSTPYNDIFLNTLPQSLLNKLKINFIKSLSEVKKGCIVIPQTSSKSFGMASSNYIMEKGDFREDEIFNRLMEKRRLEEFSISKLKTFGTSKIWVHENEITSYLDYLKVINENDRYRGLAWILNAERIQKALSAGDI